MKIGNIMGNYAVFHEDQKLANPRGTSIKNKYLLPIMIEKFLFDFPSQ
jgi:hypothetical protein